MTGEDEILRYAQDDRMGARDDKMGTQDDKMGARDDKMGAQDDKMGTRDDKGYECVGRDWMIFGVSC
jgi:hypothetical protein